MIPPSLSRRLLNGLLQGGFCYSACVRSTSRDEQGSVYLGEHGLAMLSDHGALVAVQRDARVVEGLLGVLEDVVQLTDAALKHRAEVTGDQRPANRCSGEGQIGQGKMWSMRSCVENAHVLTVAKTCRSKISPRIQKRDFFVQRGFYIMCCNYILYTLSIWNVYNANMLI